MLDDVPVYGVEGLAQWGEQFFGQASKEQPPDQVDVAGGGGDDRSPAVGSQADFGRPPVLGCQAALDQTTAFHAPGVMRQAAPLPTDQGRQGADLHTLVGYSAQGVEDIVVGKREVTVCLELAVHLVPQPLLKPHIGEPGTQFVASQPNDCASVVLLALT